MMAIGDDELLVRHRGLDGGDFLWIGNYPQAMNDIVFIADFRGRRGGGFDLGENSIHALFLVGIKQEELAGVSACIAEQFEAIGFWSGESVFMAEDHAGGILFELTGTDKAATRAAFRCTRN